MSWFGDLCLLYLCVVVTLFLVGVYGLINELYAPEVTHYISEGINFLRRCDEVDCADRFIDWIESDFPLTPDPPSGCGRIINGTAVKGDCSEW